MKFLIVFVAAVYLSSAQEDGCSGLAQCLDKLGDKIDSCLNSPQAQQRLTRLKRRCGDQVATLMEERPRLQVSRVRSLVNCLSSPLDITTVEPRAFCSAAYKESSFRRRRQAPPSGCRPRQIKQQKDSCKKLAKSCPNAKLCHLCYELSNTHDRIKTNNYSTLKARSSSCPGPQRPQKVAVPGLDESFNYVNF